MDFQSIDPDLKPDNYFMKVYEVKGKKRVLIDIGNDFNATKSFMYALENIYPSKKFELVLNIPKQDHKVDH